MKFSKTLATAAIRRSIPLPVKKALKKLMLQGPYRETGNRASKSDPRVSGIQNSQSDNLRRITIPPLGSVEFEITNIEADSVIQLCLSHEGMSKSPAKLLLEGVENSGKVKTRRWINNDRKLYRTSFFSDHFDERIRARLSNKSNKENIWIDISSIEFARVQEKPQNKQSITFSDKTVTVSMATYPGRANTFPDAVESLIDQCDNLLIYLNSYRQVPDFIYSHPQRHKINYILDTGGDLRAAAKFTWANNPGYHIICDDDIVYPNNYSEILIGKIEEYQRKAIIGVHAAILKNLIPEAGSYRQEVLRFQGAQNEDRAVNLLGTGTIGYHSDTVSGWDWSILRDNPISNDEAVAVMAKRFGVPLIAIKRSEGWMKSHEEMSFGIYEEKSLMPGIQARVIKLLRDNEPWPTPVMPEDEK